MLSSIFLPPIFSFWFYASFKDKVLCLENVCSIWCWMRKGEARSDTLVADFHCYTECRVTAACHQGLTDGILSQGTVQHSYKFCLRSFSLHLLTWLHIQIFYVKSRWIYTPMEIHCKLVTHRSVAVGRGFGLFQMKEGWVRWEVMFFPGSHKGKEAFTPLPLKRILVARAVISLCRRCGKTVLIPASIARRLKIRHRIAERSVCVLKILLASVLQWPLHQ